MANAGVGSVALSRIAEDSVGYAMIEVLRTALGFAGARDPGRRIEDGATLERFQNIIIEVVHTCMTQRRGKGTAALALLLAQLGRLQHINMAGGDAKHPRDIDMNTESTPEHGGFAKKAT